jgi:hypothetical protein
MKGRQRSLEEKQMTPSRSSDAISSPLSAAWPLGCWLAHAQQPAENSESGILPGAAARFCKLMEGSMPAAMTYTMSRSASAAIIGIWLAAGVPVSASANVITDWDEKAIAVVFPAGPAGVSTQVYSAQRMMGMVHTAMFDAVNSIERRYRPYLVQLPADPRKPPLRRQLPRSWRQSMKRPRAK